MVKVKIEKISGNVAFGHISIVWNMHIYMHIYLLKFCIEI
jgi:hypothetical protein